MNTAPQHTEHPFLKVLGILLALCLILVSEISVYQADQQVAQQTEQEQPEDSSESGLMLGINKAVTSTIQYSVSFQSILIVALPEFEEVRFESAALDRFLQSNTKKVKVLFRSIISPNAP